MLIEKDCTGKTKSIYQCDRCKKRLDMAVDERYKVSIYEDKIDFKNLESVKKYDLCRHCYILLYRAIEKGCK
jgi:hypothetical protein